MATSKQPDSQVTAGSSA